MLARSSQRKVLRESARGTTGLNRIATAPNPASQTYLRARAASHKTARLHTQTTDSSATWEAVADWGRIAISRAAIATILMIFVIIELISFGLSTLFAERSGKG